MGNPSPEMTYLPTLSTLGEVLWGLGDHSGMIFMDIAGVFLTTRSSFRDAAGWQQKTLRTADTVGCRGEKVPPKKNGGGVVSKIELGPRHRRW